MTLKNQIARNNVQSALNAKSFAVCPGELRLSVPILWPTAYSIYEYALERAVQQVRATVDPSLN